MSLQNAIAFWSDILDSRKEIRKSMDGFGTCLRWGKLILLQGSCNEVQ